jgi:regulator of sigma E protease
LSNFLFIIAAFAVALGILVVVHEFGHYVAARWSGVKVLRFSVGFGRPLLVKRAGPDATEWAIGLFPLGGYVKMLDEREGPVPVADMPRAFNRQPVLKRIAIVIAGPLANFILAIVIYWVLFVVGIPGIKPILAEPGIGTAAAQAGFRAGDRIVTVGAEPVATWQDVRWVLIERAVQRLPVTIETQDERGHIGVRSLNLAVLSADDLDSEFLTKLGLNQFRPPIPAVVGQVVSGGAAARAGLREGDEIKAVNSQPVGQWQQVVDWVRKSPNQTLQVDGERAGAPLHLQITPVAVDEGSLKVGKIGAGARVDMAAWDKLSVEVRYPVWQAFAKAVAKTWEQSVFSLKMLGKMIVGEVSWKNISGPIAIADYAGQSAHLGILPYVSFIALISISLGVLNLLPVPLLDGGHLLYYVVEIIKGSPVSEKIMEIGQQIGMALLLGLMVFAFYNDINHLLAG